MDSMKKDAKVDLKILKVDGGMTNSDCVSYIVFCADIIMELNLFRTSSACSYKLIFSAWMCYDRK
jgi:glycerol kinase